LIALLSTIIHTPTSFQYLQNSPPPPLFFRLSVIEGNYSGREGRYVFANMDNPKIKISLPPLSLAISFSYEYSYREERGRG